MTEMFAFEIPTAQGRIRIVGPSGLSDREVARAVEIFARVLPILADPEPTLIVMPVDFGEQESVVG